MSRLTLDPYVALEQFNTGFAQQSQHADAQRRLELAQQAQALQQAQFGYRQDQDSLDHAFRQQQLQQNAQQFQARQGLDEQQFGLSQDHFGLQQRAFDYRVQQQQIEQGALSRYAEMVAGQLEAENGLSSAAPGMPGSGQYGPPADMGGSSPFSSEPGQDDRPTDAPQQGQGGYVGMQGQSSGNSGGLAGRPSADQEFTRMIANRMRALATSGLPQHEAMGQMKELADVAMQFRQKKMQAQYLRQRGGRFGNSMADALEADLDQTLMRALMQEQQAAYEQAAYSDPNDPRYQRSVANFQQLMPDTDRRTAQAFVEENRGKDAINQVRPNMSGRTVNPRIAEIKSEIELLTRGANWDDDQDVKAHVAALKKELIGMGKNSAAPGEATSPQAKTVLDPKSGKPLSKPASEYLRVMAEIRDEYAAKGKKISEDELKSEARKRLGD